MRIVPEAMQRLWDECNIRGMVLGSLTVQIILIAFGGRRKYIREIWIQVLVWSMYMIADWLAIFCLGKLSDVGTEVDSCTTTNNKNDAPNKNELKALWAPLLLLHLGGPDTITAYSMEDIRLVLRHVLGLLFNVGLAIYVFLSFWTGVVHSISTLAFPLFVAGIFKYGERSWVLWRANNVFPQPRLPVRFANAKNINYELGEDVDTDGMKMLSLSYIWLQALVPCFTGSKDFDNRFPPSEIANMIWREDGGEDAFKIFEFQLGFLYDMLYTKANNIYTKSGCIVRLVSFVCVVTALLGFSILSSNDYKDADVCITYVLLVGAIVLEVYALKLMMYSDWVLIWMSKHCNNSFWKRTIRFLAPKLLWRKKRWASSLPTLSLFNKSLYDEKPTIIYWISKHFGDFSLHEKFKAHACRRDVDDFTSVKKLVMEEVKRILQKFSKWDYLHQYPTERGQRALRRHQTSHSDSSVRGASRGSISDYFNFFDKMNLMGWRDRPNWYIDRTSFDTSIVIWHLATSYCYYAEVQESSSREGAILMSDYMMYLLVSRPHMLGDNVTPCDLSAIIGCYAQLMTDVNTTINHGTDDDFYRRICRRFSDYEPEFCTRKYGRNSNMGSLEYGRIAIAARDLATTLTSYDDMDKKWGLISEVWAEMLCHAAARCKYESHLRELMRGGEFISQVWLLLRIHGLIEESPTNFLRSLFISAIPGTDSTRRSNENWDESELNLEVEVDEYDDDEMEDNGQAGPRSPVQGGWSEEV